MDSTDHYKRSCSSRAGGRNGDASTLELFQPVSRRITTADCVAAQLLVYPQRHERSYRDCCMDINQTWRGRERETIPRRQYLVIGSSALMWMQLFKIIMELNCSKEQNSLSLSHPAVILSSFRAEVLSLYS